MGSELSFMGRIKCETFCKNLVDLSRINVILFRNDRISPCNLSINPLKNYWI